MASEEALTSKKKQRLGYPSAAERERRARAEADRKRRAAQWDVKSGEAEKAAIEWRRRWMLSLTIGNGAGLLGLSTILLDAEKRPVDWQQLLVPSAWSFLLGLLAAASIPLWKSYAHSREKDWAWVVAREVEEGGQTMVFPSGDEPVDSVFLRKRYRQQQRRFETMIEWCERLAGIFFAVGLLVPLVQLTIEAVDWTRVWTLG
jgi:hypothetical protein